MINLYLIVWSWLHSLPVLHLKRISFLVNCNKWTLNLWRLWSAPDLFIAKKDESKKQESKQEQEDWFIYLSQ